MNKLGMGGQEKEGEFYNAPYFSKNEGEYGTRIAFDRGEKKKKLLQNGRGKKRSITR